MAHFVLVHGAMHGAWCWYKLTPQLKALGHEVTVLDLPGHGIDRASLTDVGLKEYSQRVVDVVEDIDGPVILVGHSLGGAVVFEASERLAGRVSALILIAAIVCRPGESGMETLAKEITHSDKDGVLPEAVEDMVISCGEGIVKVNKAYVGDLYYHDCDQETVELARSLLVASQLFVLEPKLTTTEEGWGKIPRAYIQCSDDHSLAFEKQQYMVEHVGFDEVVTMHSSHSPFVSMPGKLAEEMDALTKKLTG